MLAELNAPKNERIHDLLIIVSLFYATVWLFINLPAQTVHKGDASHFERSEKIAYIPNTLFFVHDSNRISRHFLTVKSCNFGESLYCLICFTSDDQRTRRLGDKPENRDIINKPMRFLLFVMLWSGPSDYHRFFSSLLKYFSIIYFISVKFV